MLQVKQLCVGALPDDELAVAAVHAAECKACDERFVEELKRQQSSALLNFTLEAEFWFRNDHLDFEHLVGLADNTFDEEILEIINIHLSTCATCREDVRSFLAFRDATDCELNVSYGPSYYEPRNDIPANVWSQRLHWRPVYAVAAIVIVAISLLIAVIALNRRSGPLEANKQDQSNPSIERNPSLSAWQTGNVNSNLPSVADSFSAATLKDAGGEVTIERNGRITGLDQVSDNIRQDVARAALSEKIEPADILSRLSGKRSGLDGNHDGLAFGLLYPTRSVVIEDRPIFSWENLPDVLSYRVYVLDANGNQVNQSKELPPTQTQWKVPTPLPRGQFFSWAVSALRNGKRVISPSASAPEMKFAVLSAEDFKELTDLKKSDSHLALGVFYARAGVLNEAEHEFESLIKLNPQSELPRKLLQSLRSLKKADY